MKYGPLERNSMASALPIPPEHLRVLVYFPRWQEGGWYPVMSTDLPLVVILDNFSGRIRDC